MTTPQTPGEQNCCTNTDKELWREREGDYYADSIHVTEHGGIGINCGGTVHVKTLRAWHKLAGGVYRAPAPQPVSNRFLELVDYFTSVDVHRGPSNEEWIELRKEIARLQHDTAPPPEAQTSEEKNPRLVRPLPANGETDCPKCGRIKTVSQHNGTWSCHKCGFTEVTDDDREQQWSSSHQPATDEEIARAAEHMDWVQVVLNGGPPCFHLDEDGSFCGRAERWEGHEDLHSFVSLANLIARHSADKDAEIAELRQKLVESHESIQSAANVVASMDADLAEQRKINDALREDKELLDWLLLPENMTMRIVDEINDDWIVGREQIRDAARNAKEEAK